MSDHPTGDDETASLARALRGRLQSLERAGVKAVPAVIPQGAEPGGDAKGRISAQSPTASLKQVVEQALEQRTGAGAGAGAGAAGVKAGGGAATAASALYDSAALDAPAVPPEERPARLEVIAAEVASCRDCSVLAGYRTQTVFGSGSPTARLMFVGEAPGADEDRMGVPFIGRAGTLLTEMITKGMGLSRDEVYIANAIKCRPPENRTPEPAEVKSCRRFLERQIEIIRPEFLCLLGKVAVTSLLETALPMHTLRQKWHNYKGIRTIVTYHPSYLLRNPPSKRDAWEDLKMLMRAMGLAAPEGSARG